MVETPTRILSLEEQLATHLKQTRTFCRSLTKDPDRADDLYSDFLLCACRKFDQYDPSRSFGNWACRVILNLHLDNLRNARRRPQTVSYDNPFLGVLPNDLDFLEVIPGPIDPDPFAMREEDAIRILGDAGVDPDFILHEHRDQSYDDLARIKDKNVGTIRSRVHRNRRKLVRHIESNPHLAFAFGVHL